MNRKEHVPSATIDTEKRLNVTHQDYIPRDGRKWISQQGLVEKAVLTTENDDQIGSEETVDMR